MAPIRTILAATDFSERAAWAFALACALARDYGSRLVLVHVAEPPDSLAVFTPTAEDRRQQDLTTQLNLIEVPDENVRAERRLVVGNPAAEILRVAGEVGADLIAIGTHGRTGVDRLLMGSVAENVLRQATCPVLTVKTPAAGPGRAPGREGE